jgi:alcohol dehydrogenase class IV
MRFSFATATQIHFGRGCLKEVGPIASGMGKKALVITGQRSADLDRLLALLGAAGVEWALYAVSGEPTVGVVVRGVQAAKENGCDLVLSIGGGSAIDTGKSIAALMTNPGDVLDYLEVVGRGKSLQNRPAPFIAIPTTAGTGSEVTRNAVLAVPEQQVKVSLRSPLMLPQAALVDPELTYSLPPEITATTGMDALAQVIEPYVSQRANPLCDLYCREGIMRAGRSLRRAYRDGDDADAREDMAFASLMGGLALANAGLGAVHGFAGPIGGMFDAPHGAVCACLLPAVVRVNARALAQRAPDNPAAARYLEIAAVLTGRAKASSEDLSLWLEELRVDLSIPLLRQFGVREDDLEHLAEKSAAASSMKANPIQLTQEELREILLSAL